MGSIAKIIQITTTPHSAAPETVRRGWIECILPTWGFECGHCPEYVESVLPSTRKGLLTAAEFIALSKQGAFEDEKIDGFSVLQEIALQVLAVHSPMAAQWFYRHGFPQKDRSFRFKLKEVKVLRSYTLDEELKLPGPLHRYDDVETGTMRQMS